jgi:hypothetical protein
MPDLDTLAAQLAALKAQRDEDRDDVSDRLNTADEKLGLIEANIFGRGRAIEDLEKKLSGQIAALEARIGAPSDKSKRRFDNVWHALQTPFYKQPAFWLGASTLPALLFTGQLAAWMGAPQVSSILHGLLGTQVAISESLGDQETAPYKAMHKEVLQMARPDGALTKALASSFLTKQEVEDLVRKASKDEILTTFSTVALKEVTLGLADLRPGLFTGVEPDLSVTRVREERLSVPPNSNVEIIIAMFPERFDTNIMLVNKDPGLRDMLTPEERQELREKMRPLNHEYKVIEQTPVFMVDEKKVETEVLKNPVGDVPTFVRPHSPLVVRLSGIRTDERNSMLNTGILKLSAHLPDEDDFTLWKMTVVVNLVPET